MKLWEKLSEIIFRIAALPYLHGFKDRSLEKILKQSLKVLDTVALNNLKEFVRSKQTHEGGFADKAGTADLYYTLFGCYLAEALELNDISSSLLNYVEQEISQNRLDGVHLSCAAIISAKYGNDKSLTKLFNEELRNNLSIQSADQPVYSSFLSMLTCYYLKDLKSLYYIKKQSEALTKRDSLPCPVLAAYLVLQKSFHKPATNLKKDLFTFYCNNGGFKATQHTPGPDLLSTAVALYSLNFAGDDLRMIKPDCLDFVDSMFTGGGFVGNILEEDPDIEYTFYGLLALGSLAD
jgi:hypothetical protein